MTTFGKLCSAVFVLALLMPAAPVFAQNTGTGSGTGSGIPQGYSVAPYFDDGRADDVIIQLNNLTIQGVNAASRMIYASQDTGVRCVRYYSLESSAGVTAPCPAVAPTQLYQISVSSDAVLLLRNRARTSFSEFAPGDRINVYGFLDADSNVMQGLIVRNLDKPALGGGMGGGYIQANNVQVLSNPAGSVFYVLSQPSGCTSYGYNGVARGASIACPLGMDSSMAQGAPHSGAHPAPGKIYRVEILPGAQVLDQYRRLISPASIAAGHRVNIYGFYTPANATIRAEIVRDLSLPGGVTPPNPVGNANLTVEVTNGSILCITAPCGLMSNVTVYVSRPGGPGYVGVTTNGRAVFQNLQPGTYTIKAAYSGYGEATQSLTLSSGENRTAYLSLMLGGYPCENGSACPVANGISVLRPNSADTFLRNAPFTIEWRMSPDQLALYPQNTAFDIYVVDRNGMNIRQNVVSNVAWNAALASQTYAHPGLNVPDGVYAIQICFAGTLRCTEGQNFRISSSLMPQTRIFSLEPSAGVPGTNLTIRGEGFSRTENVVRFGNREYRGLGSSDGRTIVVPGVGYEEWYCPPGQYCTMMIKAMPPGSYPVTVASNHPSTLSPSQGSTSNTLYFLLHSQNYFVQGS